MKNDIETCLTLERDITIRAIESMVHYNIKSMCFEELEKQSINKASEILLSDFLNMLNTYFEIADGIGINQYSGGLIEVADGFVHSFKIQVLKNLNSHPVSTGLLFIWIPIIMMLNHSAKNTNSFKFQAATTHLEFEVHKFAVTHLNHILNKQAVKFNNGERQSHPVNIYKFKHTQYNLN